MCRPLLVTAFRSNRPGLAGDAVTGRGKGRDEAAEHANRGSYCYAVGDVAGGMTIA